MSQENYQTIRPGTSFAKERKDDPTTEIEYGLIDDAAIYQLYHAITTHATDTTFLHQAVRLVEELSRGGDKGALVRSVEDYQRTVFDYRVEVWTKKSLDVYTNKRVRILSDEWTEQVGISGYIGPVRSIYKGKLQVHISDGTMNPYELLPHQVEIV